MRKIREKKFNFECFFFSNEKMVRFWYFLVWICSRILDFIYIYWREEESVVFRNEVF